MNRRCSTPPCRTLLVVSAALSLAFAASAELAAANPSAPRTVKHAAKSYDFNGDGRQDLVSGIRELIALDGTPHGLARHATLFTTATEGMPPTASGLSELGDSLTSADFNRDGYADVAAADPDQAAVFVLLGSKRGLSTAGSYKLTAPDTADAFSGAVKAADVNNDGWPDLIAQTGVPGGSDIAEQVLTVMYGGPSGVSTDGSYQIPSPDPDLADFGSELATGRVDADAYPDLVVGSSGNRDADDGNTAGGTWYCPGTSSGPTSCTRIGATTGGVAIGQVEGSKRPDVISADAGVATVYRGTADGLANGVKTTFASGRTSRHTFWPSPLTVASLNRDKYDDVVLGDIWWHYLSGRVVVLNGGRAGLSAHRRTVISQATKGVPGSVNNDGTTEGALFGWSVSALDVNGRGRADLIVGAPDGPTHTSAQGEVYYFRDTAHGPSTPAEQLLRNHLKGVGGHGQDFGSTIGEEGISTG
jgi:hypothetical protein